MWTEQIRHERRRSLGRYNNRHRLKAQKNKGRHVELINRRIKSVKMLNFFCELPARSDGRSETWFMTFASKRKYKTLVSAKDVTHLLLMGRRNVQQHVSQTVTQRPLSSPSAIQTLLCRRHSVLDLNWQTTTHNHTGIMQAKIHQQTVPWDTCGMHERMEWHKRKTEQNSAKRETTWIRLR